MALQLLRALEEMLIKGATHNLIVRTRSEVALYVLNHKRAHLRALEERFRLTITVAADTTVTGQQSYVIDRGEQVHSVETAKSLAAATSPALSPPVEEDEEVFDAEADPVSEEASEALDASPAEVSDEPHRDGGRRRRRRGRGRGRGGEPREGAQEGVQEFTHETIAEHAVAHEDHDGGSPEEDDFAGQPHQGGAPPAPKARSMTAPGADGVVDVVAGVAIAGTVKTAMRRSKQAAAMTKRRSSRNAPRSNRTCSMRSKTSIARRRRSEAAQPPGQLHAGSGFSAGKRGGCRRHGAALRSRTRGRSGKSRAGRARTFA